MTGHLIPSGTYRFWRCLGRFSRDWWRQIKAELEPKDNLTPGQRAFVRAKLTPDQRRQMRNILASGEGPTL